MNSTTAKEKIQPFDLNSIKKVSDPVFSGVYINKQLLKEVRGRVGSKGLSYAINLALAEWLNNQ